MLSSLRRGSRISSRVSAPHYPIAVNPSSRVDGNACLLRTRSATACRRPLFERVNANVRPSDPRSAEAVYCTGIKEGRAALVAVVVVLHLHIFFIK